MKNKEFVMPLLIGSCLVFITAIVMLCINKICALLCLIMGVLLLLIFAFYTKKRYEKINDLNNYLSLVCNGDYSMNISDNTEGELSILKNNLYKVITIIKSSNEAIQNDKVYLTNSLADISHQLKTPLTSIMVITDLIKDEEDDKKRKEFVTIIENQCEKMKWLILTLLKLSKLDAQTAEFINVELKVSEIIEESLKPFLINLELKNIKVIKNIDEFTFVGDKNWSVEAIENIIKNCIEHTGENGVLTLTTSCTTLYNQITIEDNGCGITPEDLPHIFERFYHGKNASSDSVGIGLALSKAILNNQNASITVESKEKIGTQFIIKFYKVIV
jgi:signal transduction histidine kinase